MKYFKITSDFLILGQFLKIFPGGQPPDLPSLACWCALHTDVHLTQ